MVAHLGLTALGLGQTMFGFAGDANDSISNAYPLKARRSWRAFFCTAKLHSAAPSTNADRAEGLVMSEQAEKFLAQWEFEHIADSDIVARADREDQARRLALRCREDAAKAGISSRDLEAAADGNLIGNMLQALDAAEFRQMYRDQLADQED
jgi:hypothetical protein